ncbi:MAG: hypothetical protein K2O16_14140 [Lachnospiraceae bacterium]|nr:hypothetical protein [Lachnospiraceae bacterium]
MKTKEKAFITVLSLGTCIAIAGCSGNQVQDITLDEVVNQTIAESETPNSLVDHINMELCENVNVDADIAVPNNFSGSVNKYKAYVEPFVRDDVLKLFGVSEQDVEQLSDNLYRNESTFFEFSNEVSGSLSIKTENAGCYYMYNPDYAESCSIIENFGEDQELDFQSSGMVKEEVIELLEEMGINNAVVKRMYALPVEYHQYIEKTYAENGMLKESDMLGERWNDIGDCYEIILTTEYDDISIYEDTYVAEDDSVYNGGKIQVIYSRDGIQRLDVPNQYRIMEQDFETEQVLGTEEILSVIKTKMNNMILTENYTVTKLELCYLPQIINKKSGDFLMQPIWKVTLNGEDITGINYLFKADIGEEIQW